MARFRVRTLLLMVGVVAFLLWGVMMGTRSYLYYGRATEYGRNVRIWREMAHRDRGIPASSRSVAAVWGEQIADYYEPIAQKYRRAMWRPWAPVAPDPAAPVFGSTYPGP